MSTRTLAMFKRSNRYFPNLSTYATVNAVMIGPNLLTAWLMSYYAGAHYLLATFAGIMVHITGAFFLHRRYTFKRMDVPIQIGLLMTLQGEALGIVIAFGIMAFSVEVLGIGEVYARLLCVPIIVTFDYLFQTYVTFGDWRSRRRE